ncbi:MAG: hypothetical protein AAFN91_08940 [Pseudomonadota bacterium]
MEALQALIEKGAKYRPRGFWMGDVSNIRQSIRPIEIARRGGYTPDPAIEFLKIGSTVASRILAYVQSESLAYGRVRYRESIARTMKSSLRAFGSDASFWTNTDFPEFENPARHVTGRSVWPLSKSTFDTGVIGCNAEIGLIFWVEEED